jgi:hypothetical protein
MFVDACAAFVVLKAGTLVIGEDPLNRFWDDWGAIQDCQTMSNRVSCNNCCEGRFRSGKLSEEGYMECKTQCESRPEFGKK